MALSEAKQKSNEKYIAKAYGSISIRWPREFCEQVRTAAETSGESLAGYVRRAIEQRMEHDTPTPDAPTD